MGRHDLWESVPVVVLHMVSAGANMASALAMGAAAPPAFSAALAATLLAAPVVGLALVMAGRRAMGQAILLLSFMGASALGAYANLVLGTLSLALGSSSEQGWRLGYFVTAVALPVLQLRGIWQALYALIPGDSEETV